MTKLSAAPVPTPAPAARVLPLGDGAFTLALDAAPGPALSARLRSAAARIEAQGPGVLDTVQSFAALTVFHAPDADRAALEALALAAAAESAPAEAGAGRRWEIATEFSSERGPDQAEAAAALGMSPEALVAALCAQDWPVLAVGFLPGFPFLGPLPAALKLPRRRQPRLRLPAGSVAIANGFAGIYPWVSPGGWHILGHTGFRLFDPEAEPAARLAAGDRVRFVAAP
jgi:KipI family sensor histidine kinase inhibitor